VVALRLAGARLTNRPQHDGDRGVVSVERMAALKIETPPWQAARLEGNITSDERYQVFDRDASGFDD
jgi:hypothetical protein